MKALAILIALSGMTLAGSAHAEPTKYTVDIEQVKDHAGHDLVCVGIRNAEGAEVFHRDVESKKVPSTIAAAFRQLAKAAH